MTLLVHYLELWISDDIHLDRRIDGVCEQISKLLAT